MNPLKRKQRNKARRQVKNQAKAVLKVFPEGVPHGNPIPTIASIPRAVRKEVDRLRLGEYRKVIEDAKRVAENEGVCSFNAHKLLEEQDK